MKWVIGTGESQGVLPKLECYLCPAKVGVSREGQKVREGGGVGGMGELGENRCWEGGRNCGK